MGNALTKQVSPAYDKLPEQVKSAMLALSILIDRIGTLPKADRDDLFQLLQDWRDASDPEEQQSIRRAMEEILAQVPPTVRTVPLPTSSDIGVTRKKWAEHVGKKIKELREAAGWTQMHLAEKAGLPQSHISRLENAEYSPTHLTITKIARAFGIEVGQIDPCSD